MTRSTRQTRGPVVDVTPILAAHIEGTVRALAKLQATTTRE